MKVIYDAYSEQDLDGDGDPHTERFRIQVPRDELVFPEVEDLMLSFRNCTGTICKSDDREFRYDFKPGPGGELLLHRLEMAERPPCPGSIGTTP